MADEPTTNPRDDTFTIIVEHDSYYRWMPITDEDAEKIVAAEDKADLDASDPSREVFIESTFPGHKLQRVIVHEPVSTRTDVHLPSVRRMNKDREAAGLARRPHHVNLAQHLADGPWPRHFPLGSLTDIKCDHPKWEAWLRTHFFEDDE